MSNLKLVPMDDQDWKISVEADHVVAAIFCTSRQHSHLSIVHKVAIPKEDFASFVSQHMGDGEAQANGG